jgi:cation:H+ antiporter
MVFVNLLLFVLGLLLLVKGSDYFVNSAANIAKKLGISEFIIGLTLVSIGTSIPELASSVIASIKQHSGIIVGNVVGSNIANVGLIVGLGATIAVIKTHEDMLKRDGYIMLLASFLFYLFVLNKSVSRTEAAIFLLLYIVYLLFLFESKSKFKGKYHFKEFVGYLFKFRYVKTIRVAFSRKDRSYTGLQHISKDFFIILLSLIAIIIGANFLVEEAIFFATLFGISETVIAISLIALGTSLPELAVTLSAVRKGFGDIVVGNIIGSNIANLFLIVGVSGLINPIVVLQSTINFAVPFMVFIAVLLLVFIRSAWKIRRFEGITFLVLYALFIVSLFLY